MWMMVNLLQKKSVRGVCLGVFEARKSTCPPKTFPTYYTIWSLFEQHYFYFDLMFDNRNETSKLRSAERRPRLPYLSYTWHQILCKANLTSNVSFLRLPFVQKIAWFHTFQPLRMFIACKGCSADLTNFFF